jgi:nitrogen fixation NifU-like protein
MDDLYRELIVEHYKNPGFRGELNPNDYTFEDENPVCGDHIRVDMRVDNTGIITEALFSGEGCAISQASADLLVESIIGKSVEDVKNLNKQNVLDLLGIELGVVRLKCALLPLKVMKAGVYGVGKDPEPLDLD